MKKANLLATFSAFLLFSTTLNAMEKTAVEPETNSPFIPKQEMSLLEVSSDVETLTTQSILINSLAYGVVEEVVNTTCRNFENILHNLLVTNGTDGIALFFEKMGKKTGEVATKQLVNMAVQQLIDTVTGPVDTASLPLKALNAIAILDGLLVHTLFDHLQHQVENKTAKLVELAFKKIFSSPEEGDAGLEIKKMMKSSI
ncbi:hypothetical protein [Candidatus Paracaedibacter symbiosus]|uniref:hypothetical protein n=1 Tax=Candidatus Paracaedibacter symbiosus TaxID=244582 RepID=UPI00050996B4|nr:hypothetical protein [Candidatus Paracaedibacter symbiosus]